MKSIGIDIGSSSIKVVEVVQNNKGLHLANFFEQPLGLNPAFDSEIEVLEFLKNLATQIDPTQTRVVVGYSQDKVSVRNKIFPFNERSKILKSLPYELEEDIPLTVENAVYEGKIIQTMGTNAEVLAVATPKNRLKDFIQKISDSGIEISVISPEGIAFANCWENWNNPPPSQVNTQLQIDGEGRPPRNIDLVLNIGHTHTLVCAFDGQSLIGVRSILWGVKHVTEAIVKKYQLSFIEAIKEVRTKAFILLAKEGASYDQVVFSDTISKSVRELAQEVKISILEFQSEFNGHVQGVALTGGGSGIINLQAYLTQQLEVAVNKTTVMQCIPNVHIDSNPHMDSVIGVALGLALEGLRKPRNPATNMLKGEFAPKNKRFEQMIHQWGHVISAAAVAFVIFVVYSVIRIQVATTLADKAEESIKTQAKAVAHLSVKQANETGVKKFIRDQRKRSAALHEIEQLSEMNSALDILRKINDAVPAKAAIKLNVKKIAIINNQVQIEGYVNSQNELSSLQAALSQISVSGKLQTVPSGLQATPGSVPFAYTMQVDRGISTIK